MNTSIRSSANIPIGQQKRAIQTSVHWLLLVAIIFLYVVIFTGQAFDLHASLRTQKADLGQMDQAIWNTSCGRLVETVREDMITKRFTDHVEPIYIFVSMIFWLWNDVRAVLLLQVLAVAAGAIPLFLLAKNKLGPTLALGFAIAWLLNPWLQAAILADIHAIPFATPLILLAFWSIDARRWWTFLVAALLVAMVKEEAALLAAGLGVWAMWRAFVRDERSRQGLLIGGAVIVVSLLWFAIATFIIVPAYGKDVFQLSYSVFFKRYGALGDSPLDIFKNILFHPGLVWSIASEPVRIRYLLGLFASFGFLSLFGLDILLFSLPVLLANLLSSFPAQKYGEWHYTAPLVPYFAVAAVYGLHRLLRLFHRKRLSSTIIISAMLIWLIGWSGFMYIRLGRGPGAERYESITITGHQKLAEQFFVQIPKDAPVMVTTALHPHLSHRRFIYQFPFGLDPEPPAPPATWALLDVTDFTFFYHVTPEETFQIVQDMLRDDWGIVDARDGYLLLHRGEQNKTVPDAFYDFARAASDAEALSQANALTLKKTEVQIKRYQRGVELTTVWLVGSSYSPNTYFPWIEIHSPAGETIYSYQDRPPALVWYPPERWQPGDRIRITSFPIFPPRYWGVTAAVPSYNGERLPAMSFAPHASVVSADGTFAMVGAWQWADGDRLLPLAPETLLASDIGPQLQPDGYQNSFNFTTTDGKHYALQTWMPEKAPSPRYPFYFWLHWPQGIPENMIPFVHIRSQNQTILYLDGPPHVFVDLPANQSVNDWREFVLPETVRPGDAIQIVVGLYDPATGQRLDFLGADRQPMGSEAILADYTVRPAPIPDFPCALYEKMCLSQPVD